VVRVLNETGRQGDSGLYLRDERLRALIPMRTLAEKSSYFEEATHMLYVTTLDVNGLTPEEYRAVLDEMGVETQPAAGIFLHLTTTTFFGYRIVEIWDSKEGFEEFLEKRLAPASKAIGLDRKTDISITPLHNFFAPRLEELPGFISSLPGAPNRMTKEVKRVS
jgi:hypothetical protein